MRRWVLHIDMDAFFASVEQLTRPTLRGRPVLVGGTGGRGVVAGASYEARALGAHSAMPMFQARSLIGFRGVVVTPRIALYKTVSRAVFAILHAHGVCEQVSIDEAFLEPADLLGCSPEEALARAEALRAEIRATTGLAASVGCGPGKQIAKIGSGLAKPDGVAVITEEDIPERVHPLPVGKLWGVGPVTRQRLEHLGIATIGDFAALTEQEVEAYLGGSNARALWLLARGYDDRPVAPRAKAKQISAEHTYPEDLTNREGVDAALQRAADQAHARLRVDGRGARTVTVKMRMRDFRRISRSATLDHATDDAAALVAVAKQLVRYPDEVGPIRLVGVGYSGLETARQDVLFPELDHDLAIRYDDDIDDVEVGVVDSTRRSAEAEASNSNAAPAARWRPTQDVHHPEYGHGWIQGIGHGKVTVRFETRTSGVGPVRTFAVDNEQLQPADPLDSLEWPLTEAPEAPSEAVQQQPAEHAGPD